LGEIVKSPPPPVGKEKFSMNCEFFGYFLKIDSSHEKKGIFSYTRIYVELDLSKVLLDKIIVNWEDYIWK